MDINLLGVLKEDENVMATAEGFMSKFSSRFTARIPAYLIATDKKIYLINKLNDTLDIKDYGYDEFEKVSICSQILMPKNLFRIIQLDKKDKEFIRITNVRKPNEFCNYVDDVLKSKVSI